MKTKRLGFTLAEILIALGIVGVIAAITLPTITSNVQNKQLAISLGKNVENIETGCQRLIEYTNGISNDNFMGHYRINRTLNGTDIGNDAANTISGANLLTGTNTFFNTKTLEQSDITSYSNSVKAYNGSGASPTTENLFGSLLAMNHKTGAYYGVSSLTENAASTDPVVGYVYIDVNGSQTPNRYGRDIFLFGITDACHMIPSGSNRMHAIDNNIPEEHGKSGCVEGEIGVGLSCTSRVVREGYKISYQ